MDNASTDFHSPMAELIIEFLAQKRALGFRYQTEEALLRRFDRFLAEQGHTERNLPRHLVELWTARREHEEPRTQNSRVSVTRLFARFMVDRGMSAYISPAGVTAPIRLDFTPYIFSRGEIRRMLASADRLPASPLSPLRPLVMPEIFRLLYACGLRVGEVLRLTVEDVDLPAGVLCIREGKFRKDRLVPITPSMARRLHDFNEAIRPRPVGDAFFPTRQGTHYDHDAVYSVFRRLLRETGIPHGGRGLGPRLHDLRHTFAVHRLEHWVREGADLKAKLPVLAAYMGHQSLVGTQRYLRVTSYIFPDIIAGLRTVVGYAIPKETQP